MGDKAARKHDWSLLAIGAVFAGGGIYFALIGIGAVPLPSRLYGPYWLAVACGLVFFAAGLSVLVRGWLAVPDSQANLPAGTPVVFIAIQWLAALTIIAGLASVATWIAFGAGTRQFSMSLPLAGSIAAIIGRTMFGFGAIVTWLMFALMAYAGTEKILRKKR